MSTLITGSAGFIGYHLSKELLERGENVYGLDNLNSYYDVKFKKFRLIQLKKYKNFKFIGADLADSELVLKIFKKTKPKSVYHLAAQAGVRLPLSEWDKYLLNNELVFINILRSIQSLSVKNFIYASSSSVYGNSKSNFKEKKHTPNPNNYYGITKYSNELTARLFTNISSISTRGLRFFSVYGPYGRPDMAYFRLFKAALLNQEFSLNGDGLIRRDFTYISDVINCILLLKENLDCQSSNFHDVVNVGGGKPISMRNLIEIIENLTDKRIKVKIKVNDKFDVISTNSNTKYLKSLINYVPKKDISDGMIETYNWFLENKNLLKNTKN